MENFIIYLPQSCKLMCQCCGESINKGEGYYSLEDNHFHSDCLLDNYSAYDVLSILGIEERIAPQLPQFNSMWLTIGKYQNIMVLKSFYDYFCARFSFYKEIVESFSELKHKNGITTNQSDQATLEKWALKKERQRDN